MKKKLETKACYGQFKTIALCQKCIYSGSCEVYTKTTPGLSGRLGMISFDHSVCEWMAAPEQYTPGYEDTEEERSRHDETVTMLAQMLKWIMSLDAYTLELVAEMIAPSKQRSGGVSVAYLAELRGCTRQSIHEKMLYSVRRFPELASLFQTALRRVGGLKSKFKRRQEETEGRSE
jgi:hypothetical protein